MLQEIRMMLKMHFSFLNLLPNCSVIFFFSFLSRQVGESTDFQNVVVLVVVNLCGIFFFCILVFVFIPFLETKGFNGVATIRKLFKITEHFCKRAL